MLRAFSLAMTILVLPLGYASADAPPDLGANAALKYWQAFAQLPKFTDAQEHKLNAEFLTMPLDAHAREIVAKADYALRMMHRAAALPHCDWGLGYEDGIELLLPHAQAARTLSTLACLRARIRFEDGHNAEAIEDIVDAMTVGRHVSMDGSLITVLLNYGIEYRSGRNARALLAQAERRGDQEPENASRRLAPGSRPRPRGWSFEEKAGLDWLIRKVKEQKDKESLLAFVSSFCSKQGDSPEQNRESGPRIPRGVRWHRGRRGQDGGRDAAVLSAGGEDAGHCRWISLRRNSSSRRGSKPAIPCSRRSFPLFLTCDGARREPTSAAPSWRRPSTSSSTAPTP